MKQFRHFKDKKGPGSKILLSLLAAVISFSLAAPSLAAASPAAEAERQAARKLPEAEAASAASAGKTEVVYAKLDEKGEVKDAYIVNRFVGDAGESFEDYGSYKEITQISLAGEMSESDGVVSVSLGEEPFYYQGQLEAAELPWLFDFTYTLDGEETALSDLSGKSGDLAITLHVEANPDCRESKDGANPWSKTDMLQIAMTFPAEAVSSLEAEGGSIAQVGSDQQVNFVILPNADPTDFEVTAKVRDFYMPGMQIAGIPFGMDLSSIEMPDLSDNQELTDLKDGTKKLSDGSKELASGLKELQEGSAKLEETLKQLTEGGKTLAGNASDLKEGVRSYTGGVNQLAESGKPLKDGLNDAKSGADDLAAGLSRAAEGINAYVDGVESYAAGVKSLTENLPALNEGSTDLENGAKAFARGAAKLGDGSELLEASSEISAALEQMAKGTAALGSPEEIAALKEQLAGMGATAQELSAASAQFKTAFAELEEGITGLSQAASGLYQGLGTIISSLEAQINTEISPEELIQAGVSPETLQNPEVQLLLNYISTRQKQSLNALLAGLKQLYQTQDPSQPAPAEVLKNGLAGMAAKMPELTSGYAAFDSGIQNLSAALPKLAGLADLTELAAGASKLAESYGAFNSGLKRYIGGVNQVLAAMKAPSEGEENLYSGIAALSEGLDRLAGGSSQLAQGGQALSGENAEALKKGQAALENGAGELASGLSRIQNGFGSYYGGVNRLSGNSASLNEGLAEYLSGVESLNDGLTQWAEGYRTFADGISDAEKGSRELAKGNETLHKGTQTMDENLVEMMDELLEDYQMLEGPQPSFASAENGDAEHVQFVIMTQAVEKEEAEKTEETAEEDKTFWDRFLDLFR